MDKFRMGHSAPTTGVDRLRGFQQKAAARVDTSQGYASGHGGNPYHDNAGKFTDASGNVNAGPHPSNITGSTVKTAVRNVEHKRAVERQLQKPFTKGVQHGLKQRLIMERNGGVHPSKVVKSAKPEVFDMVGYLNQPFGKR